MSQDNTSKRIDSVDRALRYVHSDGCSVCYDTTDSLFEDTLEFCDCGVKQAKNLIMELILERESALLSRVREEVIGEDETRSNCPCAYNHRNQLKHDQRTKLDQLSKENRL